MSDKQLEDYIIENNLISKLIAKQKDEMPGYAFIQLPDYLENLFTISIYISFCKSDNAS